MIFVKSSNSWHDSNKVSKQRVAGSREIWFWVLLLGSWMMLNSPAWPNQMLGGLGSVGFLAFAFRNLGKLCGMGMDFADWKPAAVRFWWVAAGLGAVTGCVGLSLAGLARQRIRVAENWRVALLQVALGPVLEEILFRGYVLRLLLWSLKGLRPPWVTSVTAIMVSAAAFGAIHLLRPGTAAVTVAVIGGVGIVYGYIRMASRSTATAAVAHAVYNVTLYLGMAL